MERKKQVLVVDDEPGVLLFVSLGLELAGYAVVTSSNGKEALQIIHNQPLDIILLDVLMVPMDGFEVLYNIRTFSQVPVIVFTARSFIAEKAFQTGANDVIGKPFKPEELIAKIEKILNTPKPQSADQI